MFKNKFEVNEEVIVFKNYFRDDFIISSIKKIDWFSLILENGQEIKDEPSTYVYSLKGVNLEEIQKKYEIDKIIKFLYYSRSSLDQNIYDEIYKLKDKIKEKDMDKTINMLKSCGASGKSKSEFYSTFFKD